MPNQIDRRKLLKWAAPTMTLMLAASVLPRAAAHHYGPNAWPECCPGQNEPEPVSNQEIQYFHNVPYETRIRHQKRFGAMPSREIGIVRQWRKLLRPFR